MKKKIMVVDDEPDQIFSLKLILEHNNEYEIIGAKNGLECLELLEKNNMPDLILLDIMMPKMNGWEVLKHIRSKSEWKDIPVIFLTALTGKDKRNKGNIVADGYIEKPYDLDDLKKTIEIIIDKKKQT